MDKLAAASPERNLGPLPNGRKWVVGAVVLVGGLIFTTLIFGRFEAVYELLWGKDRIRRLLYEDIGLSDAWSSFIGTVISFFLTFAWVPLSAWTLRLLFWKFNARQIAIAFLCTVVIYGHVPLIHALFGTNACFNQQTGTPLKWYTEGPNGDITLFDSDGYDTERATQKLPVTTAICSAVSRKLIAHLG